MPWGSRVLIQRSRLLDNNTVSDIVHDNEIVGWKYKGESYDQGLLLKTFPHNQLKLVSFPHIDDIWLFLDSEWDKHFLKKTMVAFLKQFLHVGDRARVVDGSLQGKLSTIISTNHAVRNHNSVGVKRPYLHELSFDHSHYGVSV
jgi:hypothetical protein